MIEALGLIGGAITRLFPSVMDYFSKGREMKHELARMEQEVKLEQMRAENRREEIRVTTAAQIDTGWIDTLRAAVTAQGQVTGDKWLDRINVSVRPILTYWWCLVLYTGAKVCFIVAGFKDGMGLVEFAGVLLTEFDRAVVGSIMGFWFVDRALRKGDGK